jgi:membrane associated rhomboid family serine protease
MPRCRICYGSAPYCDGGGRADAGHERTALTVVIPIGDINPTRSRPHVNWLFIVINLAVFAWQHLQLDSCDRLAFIYRFAVVPREVLGFEALSASTVEQAIGSCAVPGTDKIVLVSLITSMFLHADLFHLLGNMLFLFVFGDNVEDGLGRLRYILFYIGGGVIAALAHVILQPDSTLPLIGASGGVAAVLGAYLIMHPTARVLTFVPFPLYLLALLIPRVRIRLWMIVFAIVKMPAWLLLGGWLAFQFVGVRDPEGANIAFEAHIAGFVAGIVLVLFLDRGRRRRGQPTLHTARRRRRPRR